MSKIQRIFLCAGLGALLASPSAAQVQGAGTRHSHHAVGHRHIQRFAPPAARQSAAGGFYHAPQTYVTPSIGVPPIGSTAPEAPVNTIPPGQPAAICGAGSYPSCN